MTSATERDGLTREAVMWSHDGGRLSDDEQHAFRYEVREHGNVMGFITADRARQHPAVRWKRSVQRDGRIEELDGDFQTVAQALAAFQT
jgi:hypothetical protein